MWWCRAVLIVAGASFVAAASASEIYKCNDDRGRQVFSDKPCGDRAQRIELKDNDAQRRMKLEGTRLQLTYAGKPLKLLTQAVPTFSISTQDRKSPRHTVRYNVGEDSYSFNGLDEGQYSINVDVDANSTNPGNFPGDFRGHVRFPNIKSRDALIPVHMEQLIHLLKPQDNQLPLVPWGSGCAQVMSWVPGTVLEWESLGPGISYTVDIRRTECQPFAWKESTLSRRVLASRLDLDLPASKPNEMYTLTMKAHNTSGIPVGTLMTHGLSGYAWDYRFRIATPEPKLPPTTGR